MSLQVEDHATIEYPAADGKPMAETDVHRQLMTDLIFELSRHFEQDADVYVSGNLLLYYREGDPTKRVSPDVFVVRGVRKGRRRVYKLWEEGRAPDVVIELSSRQTWREDLHDKWRLYEELGVKEYYIFDPEYDYLVEPLVGYRLEAGRYVPIEVTAGKVLSQALGLELVDNGETLRLFDPGSQRLLLTTSEENEARLHAEEARQRAEAEVAKLQEEIERLRKDTPSSS